MATQATTTRDRQGPGAVGARERRAPDSPTDLTRRSWFGVVRRTVREFKADNLGDMAAALTYYGILAIFPALLAVISVLGLIGTSATQPLLDSLGTVAPGPAQEIFQSAIENLQKSQGSAGILLIIGLGGAIWSASAYVAAFMRASNVIYDVEEGRPVWKTLPVRVLLTLVLVVLLAVTAVAVVFTGGLATQAGKVLGVGGAAVTAWDIAKWPILFLVVSFMLALLYFAFSGTNSTLVAPLGGANLKTVSLKPGFRFQSNIWTD